MVSFAQYASEKSPVVRPKPVEAGGEELHNGASLLENRLHIVAQTRLHYNDSMECAN